MKLTVDNIKSIGLGKQYALFGNGVLEKVGTVIQADLEVTFPLIVIEECEIFPIGDIKMPSVINPMIQELWHDMKVADDHMAIPDSMKALWDNMKICISMLYGYNLNSVKTIKLK